MFETRVLIVDDDALVLRLCERMLTRASFQVITANDPFTALEILKKQPVDLLLVDIYMPEMDGFELIMQGRQYQADMAVLVMTGYGTIEMAIKALRQGVDGLILKPFEGGDQLLDAARAALVESQRKRDAGRLQALRPLFDISETLISETNLQPLQKLILESAGSLLQAPYVAIYRQLTGDSEYELVSCSEAPLDWHKSIAVNGLVWLLLQKGNPLLVNCDGPGDEENQALLMKADLRAAMVVIVNRGNKRFVFFAARGDEGVAFTHSDLEMFVILSRQSAVAIENAELYEDLRKYIRRLEESQKALVQAEKMAAVGRLMASVAHEVNNPLQSVRNCLHLVHHQGVGAEQSSSYLDMATKELDRLSNTVQRMLEFYRPGRIEKEKVNIEDIIDRLLELLRAQLKQREVVVLKEFKQPLPMVMVARDQIQQVFFNLFLNALDAMNEVQGEKKIWVEAFPEGGYLRVTVEDAGVGIDEELQQQIFEPFVSTKPEGTGLGLSVSYGIIEAHGGMLRVIPPKHANGACFEVALPIE
ncbi:MAG: response regulator [Anaerolineales bacterium]